MKKNLAKSIILILVNILVFAALIFGLNLITAPIIEKNNSGKELESLKVVLPEGTKFEVIYDKANASASTLVNVGSTVSFIYKETNGKGFVFKCQTTSQYSKTPLQFTMGVSAEGVISGVTIDNYEESKPIDTYPQEFIGQNSTLADVGVWSGATYTSVAFKDAVREGLNALVTNNLIKEAEKTEDQLLKDLIVKLHTGLANGDVLKTEAKDGTGSIVNVFEANNKSGFAMIMKEGEKFFLAVTNDFGGCKVYDVLENDVTSEHQALKEEALKYQKENGTSYKESLVKKVSRLMTGAENFEELTVDVYSTVTSVISFTCEGKSYYAFSSKSYGFDIMNVYYILDESGAIVKMTADEFVFDIEYYPQFDEASWNENNYRNNFIGLTDQTFDGSQALIATATLSTNAIKTSTNDIFAAFKVINGGN